jgi:Zn-dependent protease
MNCQICGIEVDMPYSCPYCGGQFCSQHRLPENHACPQISRARTQRQNTVREEINQTGSGGYNYSFNFKPQPTRTRRSGIFSPKELKHLGIAALLVIGIGFSISLYNIRDSTWLMSAVFSVCLMSSFLVHELAHKIVAQKHGLWAEFRLTIWGAVLTLAAIFLPLFKIIAPGAMMISGPTNKWSILKISVAGPITNIIFSSVFCGLSPIVQSISSGYSTVLLFIGYINAFIALFNLLPFGVFDGLKIFRVDKKIWAIAFIASLVLLIYGYMKLFA